MCTAVLRDSLITGDHPTRCPNCVEFGGVCGRPALEKIAAFPVGGVGMSKHCGVGG